MNKKSWVLIGIVIALGVLYIVYFTNWFKPKVLHVSHAARSGRINFSLGGPYQLTSVRVVSVSALQSNKYALAAWELKSDSNSVPTKFFFYGERIPGMKPPVSNARPERLKPGEPYRLFVQTPSLKAEHDFTP
jgi:hypothetical protein